MNTYCIPAVATLVLVAASGAMGATSSTDSNNSAHTPQPLTREAVIADQVASRQAAPTLPPRDGEWYNVPAPLGHMDRQVHHADRGSAKGMPMEKARMETSRQ